MINKCLVYVSCMTFNHSLYIKDALDGFCMQQTDFPFVCGIIDDASTDGEPEVIQQYIEENFVLKNTNVYRHDDTKDYVRVFCQHKTNKNCFFNIVYLKYNHFQIKKSKGPYMAEWLETAKYVALCEGDDYWTDSMKLQKQVNFMEKHSDYVLCHTDYEATVKRRTHYKERFLDGVYFPRMLNDGFMIGTLTVMYRKNAYDLTPKYYIGKDWPMTDKPTWYELASLGKIKYISEETAMYRILPNSASHFQDVEKQIRFKQAGLEIRQFYARKYGVHLENDGYTAAFYSSLLYYAYRHSRQDLAEKFYQEAKNKKLLTLKSRMYYMGTRNHFFGRLILLFIKRRAGN